MLRYLRLYAACLRFSFSRALEFRLDFWFRVVMDLVYYAISIAFYRVIYEHTDLLGGWDQSEVMVFVGAYLVVDALHMTVFANNLWWLPIHVNRGDLDFYLVRPVSSLFLLTLREFAANSFVNLLMAGAILVGALLSLGQELTPPRLWVFGFLLLNGAVLYAMVHLLFLLPVFWMHSARGLGNLFFLFSRVMERPDTIFHGWVRRMLLSVLPFALMASVPTRFLLDGPGPRVLAEVLVVTFGMGVAVGVVWKRALRAYSSASS